MTALPNTPLLHSYSGSDARVFAHFTGFGQETVELDSLQTVSWSVFEAKGPARALGHRGVKGYARGIRTIAGSMVLTVVGDNPLRPLLTMCAKAEKAELWKNIPGWSVDSAKNGLGTGNFRTGNYWGDASALKDIRLQSRLAALIPPFNLSVVYAHEYPTWEAPKAGSNRFETADFRLAQGLEDDIADVGQLLTAPSVAWRLGEVEFITEGVVTSINDSITEVTAQFVAREAYPLTRNNLWNSEWGKDTYTELLVPNEIDGPLDTSRIASMQRPAQALQPRTRQVARSPETRFRQNLTNRTV